MNIFIRKIKHHQIVRDAEVLAKRMEHRGACACDNDTGDGAGVLTAIPHQFYAAQLRYCDNIIITLVKKILSANIYYEMTLCKLIINS